MLAQTQREQLYRDHCEVCEDKTAVVKNRYGKRWTSRVSSHGQCSIIVWCFKGTVSELLLTLWRSCRVSVCFCPACRSDSPTQTACQPDLRNQTADTRTIPRQTLNELIWSRESDTWWVRIKHRDKLCSDVNLLRMNDTDRQFPQNTLDSCKSFLKTHHQFPRLFSSLQAAIFTSIKLSVKQRKLFWTMIRSQTSGRRISSNLFWNV